MILQERLTSPRNEEQGTDERSKALSHAGNSGMFAPGTKTVQQTAVQQQLLLIAAAVENYGGGDLAGSRANFEYTGTCYLVQVPGIREYVYFRAALVAVVQKESSPSDSRSVSLTIALFPDHHFIYRTISYSCCTS